MTNRIYSPGEKLPSLTKLPITKTQLVMYAGASSDFNPIHTVEEFAQEAGLGGVIAHGMLTMAFVGQLLTDFIGDDGRLVTFGVRFQEMVRPGDVITCEGQIEEVTSSDASVRKVTTIECSVFARKDDGTKVVDGRAVFVVNE